MELLGQLQDEAASAMVLHRLLDPGSKRTNWHWVKEKVYRPEFEQVELYQLYRALGHLVQGKERMEEALFLRNCDLFSLGVDLVLFDTTLVHFEGRGPEGLAAFGCPENYPDCVKVLVGLVMTGDGFPVAHQVFPGNTPISMPSALRLVTSGGASQYGGWSLWLTVGLSPRRSLKSWSRRTRRSRTRR